MSVLMQWISLIKENVLVFYAHQRLTLDHLNNSVMKHTFLIAILFFLFGTSPAQIDVGGKIKSKVNQRIDQKTNQAIDKTLDETEEGVKGAAKGDKNKNKEKEEKDAGKDASKEKEGSSSTTKEEKPTFKTYGKFDFIAGEKTIVEDNFSQVAIGDFPVEWNTNSGGEVVTVNGAEGKWLMISKEGVFMPDYITDLPDNYTMQFDIMCNEGFSFYSSALNFAFVPISNRGKLNDYGIFSHTPLGVRIGLHPNNAGGTVGTASIYTWDLNGEELINNDVTTTQFHEGNHNLAHVSIWRQKQRLRVYLNEEKVLDIPRAFDTNGKYNAMVMSCGSFHQDQDRYLLSNIRLAVGAPDTRSKLITEGKFVTRGILFDIGSDKIKAESYGALKDIANVLSENATVKVRIIGHTDSDGDDTSNLELSKKRAAAVKEALTKEFAIDASRMEADGKGESQPSDKNDTAVGKANNRRVEFVKIG